MGRSIRNKPKNIGRGSTVSDAQLQTKADVTSVSAPETIVDGKAYVTFDPESGVLIGVE